mgnify:FL=1
MNNLLIIILLAIAIICLTTIPIWKKIPNMAFLGMLITTTSIIILLATGIIFSLRNHSNMLDRSKYDYRLYSLMIASDMVRTENDLHSINEYNYQVKHNQEMSNNIFVGYFYEPFNELELLDYDKAYNSFVRNNRKE